jgi:hypothetical protein
MTARRSIPLLALAAVLTIAVATAQAGPVGSEYVPQVPKAGNKHHDSGGSSSGTSSSSYTSTTSTASDQPTQTTEPKAKPKHQANAVKPANLSPASSSGGSTSAGGGSAWTPIAIVLIAGAVTAAAGLTLRRRAA